MEEIYLVRGFRHEDLNRIHFISSEQLKDKVNFLKSYRGQISQIWSEKFKEEILANACVHKIIVSKKYYS